MNKWKNIIILLILFAIITIILITISIILISIILKHKVLIKKEFLTPTKKDIDEINKKYSGRKEIIISTIYISIPSFRDKELVLTIEDIFKKAYKPERIWIGVVEQNDPNDHPDTFAKNAKVDQKHIRVYNMLPSQAKGVTYARTIGESMWKGEEYFLQCDSHMRFEYGWDAELIDMLLRCPKPFETVISMYPEGYLREEDSKGNVSYSVAVRKGWRRERYKFFNAQGIVEFESVTTNDPIPEIPQKIPFWSACLAFSSSNILKQIPFHPNTNYLFFGEEIFMTARLFTHGWDIRGPRYSIAYHLWKRDYRPTYWSQNDNIKERDNSIQLVKDHLLGYRNDIIFDTHLTIGNKKTLNELWNYMGLDPIHNTTIRPHDPWTLPHRNMKLLRN